MIRGTSVEGSLLGKLTKLLTKLSLRLRLRGAPLSPHYKLVPIMHRLRTLALLGAMVNFICQLTGLRDAQIVSKAYFWVYLGGCFWKRLAFELVD